MPDKKVAEKIKLFADKKAEEATAQIGTRLLSDDKFRSAFIKNPTKALADAGLKDLGRIELSKRDVALLNLLGDQTITEMYRAGQFDRLQEHVTSRYEELINPGGIASVAVADFDVAIEVEAVAVAVVAVAAVVVGAVERFTDINVLQARFAALETRLKTFENMEARIKALETRIR